MRNFTLAAVAALTLAAPAAARQLPAAKDAEALPPAPKADANSKHVQLSKKADTFILETKPDDTKRVLVAAEVCLREGPLEVFLCKARTKEHEAILRADLDARLIHSALVAAGGKVGKPVQFVNPKTGDADYKPATGGKVIVTVHYTLAGKTYTHPAQDWVVDSKTKKPMTHQWVFAGSRFVKNADRPEDPDFYTANNGEVVGISNFPDSMLDLPVEISKDDSNLAFEANTAKIPPIGSKVWVIFEPEAEKKK